jgi:hypothetical protein
MRTLAPWLLLGIAACSGGSSSSSGTSGGTPELFTIDGLTEGAVVFCVTGGGELPKTFVIRNVSGTTIELRAAFAVGLEPSLPKPELAAGESETITLTYPQPVNGVFAPGTPVNGSIEITATSGALQSIPPEGSIGAPGSGMTTPAAPTVQTTSVSVRFDVDDRVYKLSTEDTRLLGQQVGALNWVTLNGAPVAAPNVVFDGPFTLPPIPPNVGPAYGGASGTTSFRLAAGGVPGEEVSGAARVAPLRCSATPLLEQPAVPLTGRRADTAKQVAAGLLHSCALDSAGAVYCWGDDASGQLARSVGSLTGDASREPLLIKGLEGGVEAIAAGRAHTCALRDGAVLCWGESTSGQCGPGTSLMVTAPNEVKLDEPATSIAARGDRSCAIFADGSVTCWGKDASGATNQPPTPLAGVSGAVQVALGDAHQCIRTAVGAVLCSGAGGRIGDGTTNPSAVPVQVLAESNEIAAGSTTTCAVMKDASTMCWGDFADGSGFPPTPVLAPTKYGIGTSDDVTIHISAAGNLRCRLGARVECSDYQSMLYNDNLQMLDVGGAHVCATFDGGKVACAGNDARKQLGPGNYGMGMLGFDGPP